MNSLKKIKDKLEDKCDSLLIISSGGNPDMNIRYYAEMDEIASGVFYWNFNSSPFVVISDLKHQSGVEKIKREERDTAYEEIKDAGGARIGYNADYVSVNLMKRLRKKLKGKKFVDVSEELALARAVKGKKELKEISKACALTKNSFEKAQESICEGKREVEVFTDLTDHYYHNGATLAFNPIVASGENSLYVHATPTRKKIKDTDTVIVDTGSRWNGYCSDFTRTYCMKATSKKKHLIELVEQANGFARDEVQESMSAGELYAKVKEFFGEKARYWPYGLGHGVGLEVHEYPSLSDGSEHLLEKGMVFTIEPGLAVPGVGGARLEQTGVLTSNGFKIL